MSEQDITEVIPKITAPAAAPFSGRPMRPSVPVPPDFAPRPRPMAPPVLRIHPGQWEEHMEALGQLRKVLVALLSLVAAALVFLGYLTLEAVQIVSAIHAMGAVHLGGLL